MAKLKDQEFSKEQIRELFQQAGVDSHSRDEEDGSDNDASDDFENLNISLSSKLIAKAGMHRGGLLRRHNDTG